MPLFVDDQPHMPDGDSLAEVLVGAQNHLETQGRIIVEVQLDGEGLTGDQLEARQHEALGDRELRLYSAQPQELAVETLDQSRARLAEAGVLQQEAAELLQQDKGQEALQKIGAANEAWLQVQQAVQMASGLVNIPLSDLDTVDQPLSACTDELIEALKGLKDQLIAGDSVALADALAYEWPELVTRWDRLMESLIEEIESRPSGS